MDNIFKDFGKRLKESIDRAGLNVNKIAEKINVSPNTIWNYIKPGIKSYPNSTVLYNISKILNVSMEYLLTGGKNNNQKSIPKLLSKEDQKIQDLLKKAEYILYSKTRHSNSLRENIGSFYEAVHDRETLEKKQPPPILKKEKS